MKNKEFESIVRHWYDRKLQVEWNQQDDLDEVFCIMLSQIRFAYCKEQSTTNYYLFKNLVNNKVVVVWLIGNQCTGESFSVPGIYGHYAANGNELTFDYAK